MNELKELLEEHKKDDQDNFGKIFDELKIIRENHLVHIQNSLSKVEADIDWIKRIFWMFAGITITSVIGALIKLITK